MIYFSITLSRSLIFIIDIEGYGKQKHQTFNSLLPVNAQSNEGHPVIQYPITKPPMIAPNTVPIPPEAEAPPIKQAAIASSSKLVPALGVAAFRRAAKIRPDTAASTPMFTNTQNVTFWF